MPVDPAVRDTDPPSTAAGLERIGRLQVRGTVNTDLAFWGRTAYLGSFDGVRAVDLSNPTQPRLLGFFDCPGYQNDVSVWGTLVFVSVDQPRESATCGAPVAAGPGWEGIRVVDMANPAAPRQVAAVATDCGSHTHTLVPDRRNRRVLLYVSSYSGDARTLGTSPTGTTCRLDHDRISVVEVPLRDPAGARVVSQPVVDLAPYFSTGGNGCHDIGAFPTRGLAAGACSGSGVLFDTTDPANPVVTDVVDHGEVEYFHSAAFTWDGRVVAFGDEAGGGRAASCGDPASARARVHLWGVDPLTKRFTSHERLGSYASPRAQTSAENCTVHEYTFAPVRGRDVLVGGWYQGGTAVVDLSDPLAGREIASHDDAALDPSRLTFGGAWAAYTYRGLIVASDITQGLEVYRATGGQLARMRRDVYLNPQTQEGDLRVRRPAAVR